MKSLALVGSLILALADIVHTVHQSDSCPVENDCLCLEGREILCSEMNLHLVPSFSKNNDTWSVIDLSTNKIKTLGPNAFRNLAVQKIKILANAVDMQLHRQAFRGLEGSVQSILLRRCHIIDLPPKLFRKLSRLRTIDLSGNRLTHFAKGVFHGARSVEILDLTHNQFTSLHTNMFMGLRNLRFLKLGDNRISFMDLNAFRGLSGLEDLQLPENEIRDLQPRTFKRLNKLKRLDLRANAIPAVFPIMFSGMTTVEELALSENPLITIYDKSFSTMKNLRELLLGRTTLTYLKGGMFKGLNNLEVIHLHHNNLTEIRDGLFASLPALRKVQLDGNKLHTVNPCAFHDVTQITEIWLEGNPIDCACTLQWAALEGNPLIHGHCQSPDRVFRRDIRRHDNYKKCKGMDDATAKCMQLSTNKLEK